jgi:hypothetical protein
LSQESSSIVTDADPILSSEAQGGLDTSQTYL